MGSAAAAAAAAVAATGAAALGAERLGFTDQGVKKGSWAATLMSTAHHTGRGKGAVSNMQSVGAAGLKPKSAVGIFTDVYNTVSNAASGGEWLDVLREDR